LHIQANTKVRDSAPIGKLEFWRYGIMGLGYWDNGLMAKFIYSQNKKIDCILILKNNIPSFHYSIIPSHTQIYETPGKFYFLGR
jgi:hypothetical protein